MSVIHRYWIHLQLVTLTASRLPNHAATIRMAQNAEETNMRGLLVVVILLVSACAGTREAAGPSLEIEARADSLLALPVDSLSSAD